ncbi:hypothetical protein KT71_002842 [Congregibacter litoralis KT71]|uniref:Uncharacterized protein n=1 Tax=Congregibacter litoralis KT71 TaxID=314285 RepID=V7HSX9_9GAMM|nr:hypothetical protein KT71_002842 [Congregibacter litoralis KT71]
MRDPQFLTPASALFSDVELLSLKAFYAGEQASSISKRLPNPWPLVARHRAQDRTAFQATKTVLDALYSSL